jgi:hypothetical protein
MNYLLCSIYNIYIIFDYYYVLNSYSPEGHYLPVLHIDLLASRLTDLVKINTTTTEVPITLNYSPISFGKLRLWLQFTVAMQTLKQMGFTDKDVDELKGTFCIFYETMINFYYNIELCRSFLRHKYCITLRDICRSCFTRKTQNLHFLVQAVIIHLIQFISCCLIFWHLKMTFISGVTVIIWLVCHRVHSFGEHSVSLSCSFTFWMKIQGNNYFFK